MPKPPAAPAAPRRWRPGGRRWGTASSLDATPDAKEGGEHSGGISRRADAGVGRVPPVHGDLADRQAPSPSPVKYLGVDFEAPAGHRGEKLATHIASEGLESALGVVQTGQERALDEEVEHATHGFAIDRLVHLDQAPVYRARPDGDVRPGFDGTD